MKSVFTSGFFVVGAGLVVALWLIVYSEHPVLTFDALNSLISGLAFVGLLATLAHQQQYSADREKEHRELIAVMQESFYVQTLAGQISANGVLVEHIPEKIRNLNWEDKMISLANEFEFAKHRAALPLGINLPK